MRFQAERVRSFTLVCLRVVHSEIRPYTETKNGRLRFLYIEPVYDLRFAPYFTIYSRISPYTTRRYAIIILSHVLQSNTIVYGTDTTVYGLRKPRPGMLPIFVQKLKIIIIPPVNNVRLNESKIHSSKAKNVTPERFSIIKIDNGHVRKLAIKHETMQQDNC
ncbi:unnamed protein product [Rotaria magnacalcarata]|uniref:Uncharacterized protein n=1 Tax=Rotaria magnacalcarata TaxID=392030 RepID=A0A816S139_9BILA|nr:unnamed protein product [Rotaria magnacalcarata]